MSLAHIASRLSDFRTRYGSCHWHTDRSFWFGWTNSPNSRWISPGKASASGDGKVYVVGRRGPAGKPVQEASFALTQDQRAQGPLLVANFPPVAVRHQPTIRADKTLSGEDGRVTDVRVRLLTNHPSLEWHPVDRRLMPRPRKKALKQAAHAESFCAIIRSLH